MQIIPKNTKELFDMLRTTEELCGNMKFISDKQGEFIIWELHDNLILNIEANEREGYIGVNKGLFHWHPENEVIYKDLCEIGQKGNIFVIKISFFYKSLFYSGPAETYKFNKETKWHRMGRLHYFGVS